MKNASDVELVLALAQLLALMQMVINTLLTKLHVSLAEHVQEFVQLKHLIQ
jgi:hypothetical protein